MSVTEHVLDPGAVVLADGLIDWGKGKALEVQDLVRLVVGVGAIVGIAAQAVKSNFALARIAVSIGVAGLLVWGVWNITDVKDKVGDEMTDAPAALVITDHSPTSPVSHFPEI